MNTQKYQDQHRELRALAGDLNALLVEGGRGWDGEPARQLLGERAGKLKVHLAMEDKVLDPTRLNRGRKEASELARKYLEEMGGSNQAFRACLEAWPSAGAIQKGAAGFIAQTRGILAAVGQRIAAEEKHLYSRRNRPEEGGDPNTAADLGNKGVVCGKTVETKRMFLKSHPPINSLWSPQGPPI